MKTAVTMLVGVLSFAVLVACANEPADVGRVLRWQPASVGGAQSSEEESAICNLLRKTSPIAYGTAPTHPAGRA